MERVDLRLHPLGLGTCTPGARRNNDAEIEMEGPDPSGPSDHPASVTPHASLEEGPSILAGRRVIHAGAACAKL